MDRDAIVDYFRAYEGFKPTILKRELEVSVDSESIITIMGPRRAGKTYYMFHLMGLFNDVIYISFDDYRLNTIKYDELEDVIEIYTELYGIKPKVLFLDEIQEVPKWELAVRTFHNLKKYKIFITGSSSKMLSREIATQLRGRTLSYLLLPFSFREYLNAVKTEVGKDPGKEKISDLKRHLRDYLEFGGFPKVIFENEKIGTLREYSDLILFKDFVERHNIKNTNLARYLHESIIQNFSREISVNSLFEKARASSIKVTKSTVYDYLNGLQDTVFFFFVGRYSKKVHLRASWPKKVYLADTGLSKIARFSEDTGRLMENAVFLELMRRRNINRLLDIYYLNDQKGEVDFLLKKADKITQLIQVTYELNSENMKRKTESLIRASEALKCDSLIIITWDREEILTINKKKIVVIPLWKWLTQALCLGINHDGKRPPFAAGRI